MTNQVKKGIIIDRQTSISAIRFIAMLMIILCHFLQYYANELAWWFNVGVQIFFVLSGFLYGNKAIDSPIPFFAKQFKKILLPYYLFLIPVIVIYVIFAPEYISIISIVKSLFCAGTIDGIGHLWFIGYILFCYLLTPFLYQIKKHIENDSAIKKVFVSIVLLALIQIVGVLVESYFDPDRITCFIVGYIIVVALKQYGQKAVNSILLLFGSVCVLMNGVRILLKYVLLIRLDGYLAILFGFFEDYAHLALGVTLFLIMYKLFRNIKNTALFSASDKYSYYVYIVHQLFILSPFSLMDVTPVKVLNWLIVLVCIFASAGVLCFVSRKLMTLTNIKA